MVSTQELLSELALWPPPYSALVLPSGVGSGQVYNGRGLLAGLSVKVGSAAQVGTVANPAAGVATVTVTVPAGQQWQLATFALRLVTSAVVANREVQLQVKDAAGNVVGTFPAPSTQPASFTTLYTWGVGAGIQTSIGGDQTIALPAFTLQPGWQIVVTVFTMDAADQLSNIVYSYARVVDLDVYDGNGVGGELVLSASAVNGVLGVVGMPSSGVMLERGLYVTASDTDAQVVAYVAMLPPS